MISIKNKIDNMSFDSDEISDVNLKKLILKINDDLKEIYMYFLDNDMKKFSVDKLLNVLEEFRNKFWEYQNMTEEDVTNILSQLADIESCIIILTQAINKSFTLKVVLHDNLSGTLRKLANLSANVDTLFSRCENQSKKDLYYWRANANYLLNLRENEIRKKKEEISLLSKEHDIDLNLNSVLDVDNLDVNILRLLLKKEILRRQTDHLENDISSIFTNYGSDNEKSNKITEMNLKTIILENSNLKKENKKLELQNHDLNSKLLESYKAMEKSLDVARRIYKGQLQIMDEDVKYFSMDVDK